MESETAVGQTRTLADRKSGRSNEYLTLMAMDGVNLGRKTLTTRLSIKKFIDWSLVANKEIRNTEEHGDEFVAQRSLSPEHARGLAKYVLGGLVRSVIANMRGKIPEDVLRIKNDLAAGPYSALQPLVCNLRHVKEEDLHIDDAGLPPDVLRLSLGSTQKLWVVDGQHRRDGFDRVIAYLDQILKNGKYPGGKGTLYAPASTGRDGQLTAEELQFWNDVKNVAMNECSVSVEIHIGLHEEEEQQLFSDLNSRSKTLQSSLVQNYDQSDAIAVISRDKDIIRFRVADESDAKHWGSTGLPLKDIIMVNRLLVHGSNAKAATSQSQVDAKAKFIQKFWDVVQGIEGFTEDKQREKTVAGQPVMLKALAKLAHDCAYGVPKLVSEDDLRMLYEAILTKRLTFKHSDDLWQALFMNDDERAAKFGRDINDYVHVTAQMKSGEFDTLNGWVRYGTAHNDIYPRLGDLIRWKLKLKNRGAAEKSREKELLARSESAAVAA